MVKSSHRVECDFEYLNEKLKKTLEELIINTLKKSLKKLKFLKPIPFPPIQQNQSIQIELSGLEQETTG